MKITANIGIYTTILCLLCGRIAIAESERVLASWDFTKATDPLGWQPTHSLAPLQVKNGALQLKTISGDPYAASPSIDIQTNEYQYLYVLMRSNVGGNAQFFWAAGQSPGQARFRGPDAVSFNLRGDGELHTYRILPFWKPGLRCFRIRFDSPEGRGQLVEVSKIAIIERAVSGEVPTTPTYDFSQPGSDIHWIPHQDSEAIALKDGALNVTVAGASPAVIGPPCDIDAAKGRYLSVQMKVTGSRAAQVWYARAEARGFPPPNRHAFHLFNDGRFHTYNVDLTRARGYEGGISRLGISLMDADRSATWAIRSLRLGDSPSGPADVALLSLKVRGAISPAEKETWVRAEVHNYGGELSKRVELELEPPKGVDIIDGATKSIDALKGGETKHLEWRVRLKPQRSPEPISIPVKIRYGGQEIAVRSAKTIVSRFPEMASLGARLPDGKTRAALVPTGDIVLENHKLRFVLPLNDFGYGVGLLYAFHNNKWTKTAVLKSLGALSIAESGGGIKTHRLWSPSETGGKAIVKDGTDGAARIELQSTLRAADGKTWRTRHVFELEADAATIEATASLACSQDAELAAFAAPELLVGDGEFGGKRDIGLFPGLEYLLPGERSSGFDFCAAPVNDRRAPHPNKVTIPIMAIIHDGLATGLTWDPLQKWDGEHDRPAAKFASPNFIDDEENHLLGLFLPSIPDWVKENELTASRPYHLTAGRDLTITSAIFSTPGDDVDAVINLWLARSGGAPDLPEMPYSYDEHLRAVIADYTKTTWLPNQRKWHRAINDPWGPAFIPTHALHLWWESQRGVLSETERKRAKEVLEAALSDKPIGGKDLVFHQGPASAVMAQARPQRRWARQQREDGAFPFTPDAKHAVFGKRGDTSSGHTARALVQIWNMDLAAGDPEAIAAGKKGLAYLDTQLRPEGAQTWELQLHVPDVLAAAWAVHCYVAAYEVTHDGHYLDQAALWAYRGLPFIYLWNPPDRPIMRYGSIPVFGATWFTGAWFGRIVQWNGLVYAESLLQLAKYDKRLDWRKITEGITICAIQQQRPIDHASYKLADYIPDCKHAGMYPDSYSAVKGTDSYHWCLSGDRIAQLSYKLIGADPSVKRTVVWSKDEKQRVHINSVAYVSDASLDKAVASEGAKGSELRFSLKYLRDRPHFVLLTNLTAPTGVFKGSRELAKEGDLDNCPEGYTYDAERGALLLKILQTSEKVNLRIDFAQR